MRGGNSFRKVRSSPNQDRTHSILPSTISESGSISPHHIGNNVISVIDLFMKFFASWGMRIIPSLFWRDMREAMKPNAPTTAVRTAHYSPFLHNAILSIACAFSDDPIIRQCGNRELFAKKAKEVLEDECIRPTISTVSGFQFLASYHSGRNEHGLGFLYCGT